MASLVVDFFGNRMDGFEGDVVFVSWLAVEELCLPSNNIHFFIFYCYFGIPMQQLEFLIFKDGLSLDQSPKGLSRSDLLQEAVLQEFYSRGTVLRVHCTATSYKVKYEG